LIIDSQVHVWRANTEQHPWSRSMLDRIAKDSPVRDMLARHLKTFEEVEMTGGRMLAEMAHVGVDAAVVVSSGLLYGTDWSYAAEVTRCHPGRFAMVSPFEPAAPDVDDFVDRWRTQPGAVGLRLWGGMRTDEELVELIDGGRYDRGIRAAQRANMTVDVSSLPGIGALARRFPELRIVVTHLGFPPDGDPGWQRMPALLALAPYPNVFLKATGVPVHSDRQFPFTDIWSPFLQIVETFGVDRIMWGSDWTRITRFDYAQGLRYLSECSQLSAHEKRAVLGGTLMRVTGWSPGTGA
jgi:L-fuconolactonase